MIYTKPPRLLIAMGVALVASLIVNAWQVSVYLGQRDRVATVIEQRDTAQAAAMQCSQATDKLRDEAEAQAKAAQAAIDKARKEARSANARADAERNRRQAVPGDACASAQAETREWLERRR